MCGAGKLTGTAFPPVQGRGRGSTSTSCRHFSVTRRRLPRPSTYTRGTWTSGEAVATQFVAAEREVDRLAHVANVTRDTD